MKLVVCVKTIPELEAIRVVEGKIIYSEDALIINPWDEYAVEAALAHKERKAGVEPDPRSVIAISVGDQRAEVALRYALAMGVDEAIHIDYPSPDALDTQGTARILAAAIRKIDEVEPVEMVFFGRQGMDTDHGLTAAQTARLLGWPAITHASTIRTFYRKIRLGRTMEEGRQIINARSPVVFSVTKDVGVPRVPAFVSKRRAERMPITVWTLEDLGMTAPQPLVQQGEIGLIPEREISCEMLTGTPEEIAHKILDILAAEGLI